MCDCIKETNEALAKETTNTELDVPIVLNHETMELKAEYVLVATRKRNKYQRARPKKLFASYCPFCGRKYPQGKASIP